MMEWTTAISKWQFEHGMKNQKDKREPERRGLNECLLVLLNFTHTYSMEKNKGV